MCAAWMQSLLKPIGWNWHFATLRLLLRHLTVNVGSDHLTSYDVPHRICDAILRGCTLEGEPYLKSAVGQALSESRMP